jgi:hypothetical protein
MDRLVALSFKVPFEFRQRLKRLALERGLTMTEVLIAAIEAYSQGHVTSLCHCVFEDRQEIRK